MNHSKRRREANAAARASRRATQFQDELLDFDTVEELGLDGTGRDGSAEFPYTAETAIVSLLNRQQRRHPQKVSRK